MSSRASARWASWGLAALILAAPWAVRADSLSSALYVRTDSDDTLVVSPRARVGKNLGESELDVTYAADVWTSASIDIRTSASPPVTEQRDEVDVALSHSLPDLTLTGSYRYSHENDYLSNGGSLGGSLELAQKSSTVGLSLSLYRDAVGKSGDPEFSRSLTTLGSRLSFTQIIDTETLGQLTYELGLLDGYQASAYRFVGFGGTGYGCEAALQCLPEHLPETRMRNAVALLVRRALSYDFSVQGNYRFYLDDWSLSSHTLAAQLDWFVADDTLLSLRYRFYTQTGVDFYQRIYPQLLPASEHWTRDRELSAMSDHRIGVDIDQRFTLDESAGINLVLTGGVGGDFYQYDEFVGLDQVSALELTLAVGLEQ